MKNSMTIQSLEPDSVHSVNNYSGILNSNYKNIVKNNFKSLKSKALFSKKQKLKIWQYNRSCCTVATSLKVLLFFTMTIIAIA